MFQCMLPQLGLLDRRPHSFQPLGRLDCSVEQGMEIGMGEDIERRKMCHLNKFMLSCDKVSIYIYICLYIYTHRGRLFYYN